MSITVVYKNSGIHTFDLVDKAYTDDNGNYVLEWLKYSQKIVINKEDIYSISYDRYYRENTGDYSSCQMNVQAIQNINDVAEKG